MLEGAEQAQTMRQSSPWTGSMGHYDLEYLEFDLQ